MWADKNINGCASGLALVSGCTLKHWHILGEFISVILRNAIDEYMKPTVYIVDAWRKCAAMGVCFFFAPYEKRKV